MRKSRLRLILIPAAMLLCMAFALLLARPVEREKAASPKTIRIYSTFGPLYLLDEFILDDIPNTEHHLLVQPQDGCFRAHTLSDWELYQLAYDADLIIGGGRGLESFESTLTALGEQNAAVVLLMSGMNLYNQEDNVENDEEAGHLRGANPHAYMSVKAAKELLETLSDAMTALDPEYSHLYRKNLDAAEALLDDLTKEMNDIAGDLDGKNVALLNEALVYPAQDLGLNITAQIERESGVLLYENEMESCLDLLRQSGAEVVLIEKQAPQAMLNALREAGFSVAALDIFADVRDGMSAQIYAERQLENAECIKKAFENIEKEKNS